MTEPISEISSLPVATPVNLSRRFSPTEYFYRARSRTLSYSSFHLAVEYSQPVTDPKLLYMALRKTIIDYPMFLCNVFDRVEEGRTYSEFAVVDKVELADVVSILASTTPPSMASLMASACEHRFKLNQSSLLFAIVILNPCHLSFRFEHIYADGVPGLYFVELFLENLGWVLNPTNTTTYARMYGAYTPGAALFERAVDTPYVTNPLPPALETYLPPTATPYTTDPQYLDAQVPADCNGVPYPRFSGISSKTGNFSHSFNLLNFTPDQTARILHACRAHSVSLTSYLKTVTAHTLYRFYGNHTTTHRAAVNLRRHLYNLDPQTLAPHDPLLKYLKDPTYRFIGCCAHAGLPEPLGPMPEFSWATTQKIHANLQEMIRNDKLNHTFEGFLRAHEQDQAEAWFTQQWQKPRPDTVKFSNLGVLRTPDANGLHITNVVFSQDTGVLGSDILLCAISTARGGLNVLVSFWEEYPDGESGPDFSWLPALLKLNVLRYATEEALTA